MKTEKPGEQVFANVDEVLAEKIISRSKENSKATEPDIGLMAEPVINDEDGNDDPLQFCMPAPAPSYLKIAAAVLALIVLVKVIFASRRKRRAG